MSNNKNTNNNNSSNHKVVVPHTYVAGQDQGRLAAAAAELGLDVDQGTASSSSASPAATSGLFWITDDTLTAARMHSVGCVAADERVDPAGALHHMVTLRRRRRRPPAEASPLHELTSLFAAPSPPRTKPLQLQQGTAQVEEEVEEEEEEEEVVIDMVEGGSLTSAAFGIIKGTVGPAVLYLPAGFYTAGWAVAVPAMVFATAMYVQNAHRLLACWRVESQRNHQVAQRLAEVQALLTTPSSGPPQYGATAIQQTTQYFTPKLLTYPELAKRALGPYALVVELGIALFQFGVCLTYLIFVPDNLRAALASLGVLQHPTVAWLGRKTVLLWIMIAVEIPLSWIRDIRKLTVTNVLASLLIAAGLVAVMVLAIWQGTQRTDDGDELVLAQNLQSLVPATDAWFLFIGTSFFMMEGSITLLVPLQEAVYLETDRAKFPAVNRNVTWWIVAFYVVFSVTACAAFGSGIQTALTASLTGNVAVAVQLAYSVAVMLTFPLQAFPAMQVARTVWQQVVGVDMGAGGGGGGASNDSDDTLRHNVFSTTIVVVLGIIAVLSMEYLGNVVSILGSLFGIPLALVFPPLLHNALVKDSSTWTRFNNYATVVVGILAMAAASFNTIVTWNSSGQG